MVFQPCYRDLMMRHFHLLTTLTWQCGVQCRVDYWRWVMMVILGVDGQRRRVTEHRDSWSILYDLFKLQLGCTFYVYLSPLPWDSISQPTVTWISNRFYPTRGFTTKCTSLWQTGQKVSELFLGVFGESSSQTFNSKIFLLQPSSKLCVHIL